MRLEEQSCRTRRPLHTRRAADQQWCKNIDLSWLQKAAGNFSHFLVTIFNGRLKQTLENIYGGGTFDCLKINFATHVGAIKDAARVLGS